MSRPNEFERTPRSEPAVSVTAPVAHAERYRMLFDTMRQGCAEIEVVRDATGRVVDHRYLEFNAAWRSLTGLPTAIAVGQLASDVVPDDESFWNAAYDRILRGGVPEHIQHEAAERGRWYEVTICPVDGDRCIALCDDVTDRKRSEDHQKLLFDISRELRCSHDIGATLERLGERIGRHFQAQWCVVTELVDGSQTDYTQHGWHDSGVSSLEGRECVRDVLSDTAQAALLAGRATVVDDVSADARVHAAHASALDIRSFVMVPLVRDGRPEFIFTVIATRARRWRDDEVTLLRELADRIFHPLQRARAQSELRVHKERVRGQHEALQAAVGGATLDQALDRIAQIVNAETTGEVRTAFYIADPTGTRLHPVRGAGNMPASYLSQIDGFPIGEDSLVCGLVVPTGRPVVIPDVADEPLWAPWLHLAEAYDFRGCWSFPIKTRDRRSVGTFAMYFRTAREARPRDLALADEVTRTAAVIIASHTEAQERVRAESALRESEARARALAELAPALLWETDPSGDIISLNPRWREYTGQTFERTQRGGWLDAVHPDDRAHTERAFAIGHATGQPVEVEYRIRRHDGAYCWFLVRQLCVRDVEGRVTRWLGAATDVHAQRMLLEEAERLAAVRTRERDVLRRQLLDAEEAERRRLARELHDEAGQHLTELGLGLQALSDVVPAGSEADRRATHLRALTSALGRELHALAVRLRPKALDDFGLESALTLFIEEWSRQSGIAVDIHTAMGSTRLPSAVENAVYRIVQEALSNVAKHSGAGRVSVIVERRNGHVVTIVEDDGRGFDAEVVQTARARSPGLGLIGMRERASLLGGTVDIESASDGGTSVFVRIPLEFPDHDQHGTTVLD